jgi:rubrerythrin
MSIHFNADEVFAMAIRIEESAIAFYHRAHDLHRGSPHASLLESLAKMEEGHKRTFEEMRRTVPEEFKAEQSYDPFAEAALYLEAMADAHGGEGNKSAADGLTGKETMDEIVDLALALEQKSILYYVGLRDLVPERLGRDKIDFIIGEEKKHVVQLRRVKENA